MADTAAPSGIKLPPNPWESNSAAPAGLNLPSTPEYEFPDPAVVAPPPVQAPAEPPGTLSNLARGIGERAVGLAAMVPDLYKTLVETSAAAATRQAQMQEGKAGVMAAPLPIDPALKAHLADVATVAEKIRDVDLGFQETYTPEQITQTWESGDKVGAAKQLAAFGLEQGIISLPDMVAILTAAPAYYAGLSAQYTQERVKNDGRTEASLQDVAAGTVTAAIVATLEKYGAEQVFGVGKEPVKGLAKNLGELMKRGLAEASTEALQNPAEFAGTRVGTQKQGEVTAGNLGAQAVFGAAGGLGGGLAIGAPVQAVQAFAGRDQAPPAPAPAAPPAPAATAPAPAPAPAAPPAPTANAPTGKLKEGDVTIFMPAGLSVDPAPVRVVGTGPGKEFVRVAFLTPEGEVATGPDGQPLVKTVKVKDLDAPMAPAAGSKSPPASPAATPVAPAPAAVATPPAPVAAAPVSVSPPVTTSLATAPTTGAALPSEAGAPAPPAAAGAVTNVYSDLLYALENDTGTVNGAKPPALERLKPLYEAGEIKTWEDVKKVLDADAKTATKAAPKTAKKPATTSKVTESYDAVVSWLENDEDGTPSVEQIRKKFKLGYDTANKLMTQLEANGVVTGEKGKRVVPNRLPKYAQPDAPVATPVAEAPPADAETKKAKPPSGPIGAAAEWVESILGSDSVQPKAEGSKKVDRRKLGGDVGSIAQPLDMAIKDAAERGAPEELLKSAREVRDAAALINDAGEQDYVKGTAGGRNDLTTQAGLMRTLADARAVLAKLSEYADKPKVEAAEKPKVTTKKSKADVVKEKSKAKEKPAAEAKPEAPAPKAEAPAAPDVALKAAALFNQVKEIFNNNAGVKDLRDRLDALLGPKWETKIERTGSLRDDALTAASDLAYGTSMSEDTEIDTDLGAASQEQGLTKDEYVSEGMTVEGQTQAVKKGSVKVLNKKSRKIQMPGDTIASMPQRVYENPTDYSWDRWIPSGGAFVTALRTAGGSFTGHQLIDMMRKELEGHPVMHSLLGLIKLATKPDLRVEIGYPADGEQGVFLPNENRIILSPTDRGRTTETPGKVLISTFVHEMLHAATLYGYRADTAEGARLREDMQEIYDQVVDAFRKKYNMRGPILASGPLYGFKNPWEMVSEAFTNVRFMETLAGIQMPNRKLSLKQKLLRGIARFLGVGFGTEQMTALDAVFEQGLLQLKYQEQNLYAPELDKSRWLRKKETVASGTPNRARGTDRLAQITTPEIASAVNGVANLSKTGAIGRARRGAMGTWTNDFLVRWTKRFFDSNEATNPLVEWKKVNDLTRSYANRIREKAERDVLAKWNQMSAARSDMFSDVLLFSTDTQLDPRKPLAAQRKKITKAAQLRYDELMKKWGKLDASEQQLYTAVQDYFKWRFQEVRKAAVDLAVDQYAKTLTPAQRTLLYAVKDGEGVGRMVGVGKLIDLGDPVDNENFTGALQRLIQVTTIEGPYFPIKRHGDHVVTVAKRQEWTYPVEEAARAKAEKLRLMSPGNRIKVTKKDDGSFSVKATIRYVSFHESQLEAEQAKADLETEGFKTNPITLKIESVSAPLLGQALSKLVTEARGRIEKQSKNPDGSVNPAALSLGQILESSFTHIMAERASVGEKVQRKNYAGYKIGEAKQSFAESVQGGAWHYAHLRTALGKSESLSRLRHYMSNPEVGNADGVQSAQDVMLERGKVVTELERRIQIDSEEYSKPTWGQALATLGFLNFLAHPAYTFINSMQNVTIGLPVITGKYGGKGTRMMVRAMRLVAGPTFAQTLRGTFLSKPGNVTSFDIYNALSKAISEDARFGKWTKNGPNGEPSALQQLVDRGTVNASFMQELAAVINAQGQTTVKAMEWARLMPQGAEMFNRLAASIAVLEVTNGNVDKAADFVDEVHLNYNQENRPRFFRKIGGVKIPQAVTMFKMYGVGMYQLVGGLMVDTIYAKTRSREEAAKTLGWLIIPHMMFAGILGTMFEPLQWLLWMWNKAFGDGPFDPNQMIRSTLKDMGVESEKARTVLTRGLPNLIGIDLSGNMGLNRLLAPDIASYPSDATTMEKMGWLAEQIAGPWPPTFFNKTQRAEQLLDQGRPFEALASLVPLKMVDNLTQAYKLADRGLTTRAGEPVPGGQDFNIGEVAARAAGFRTTQESRDADKARYSYRYNEQMRSEKSKLLAAVAAADTPAEKAKAVSKIREWLAAHPGQTIDVTASLRGRDRAARERSGAVRDPVLRERLSE